MVNFNFFFCNCLGNWGKSRHFRKCLGISRNAWFLQFPATYIRDFSLSSWIQECLFSTWIRDFLLSSCEQLLTTWEWKIPYSSWEPKFPYSNQLTLKVIWLGRGLNSRPLGKTPLHALTNWAIGTDMKRDNFSELPSVHMRACVSVCVFQHESQIVDQKNTRLASYTPSLCLWAHGQPCVLLMSYPFWLQMLAGKLHVQLKLCIPPLRECTEENLPLCAVGIH